MMKEVFMNMKIIWNSSSGYDILIPGVNCEIDICRLQKEIV